MERVVFVSGHLNVTQAEFDEHYAPRLLEHIAAGARFVVGDARGADKMAQDFLKQHGAQVTVFHMFTKPRNNAGFPTRGGYSSDNERDSAMTAASTEDVAWIRPGRETSGTAANLRRRVQN